jgi:hypothetical protein
LSAVLVQANGRGLSFQVAIQSLMSFFQGRDGGADAAADQLVGQQAGPPFAG